MGTAHRVLGRGGQCPPYGMRTALPVGWALPTEPWGVVGSAHPTECGQPLPVGWALPTEPWGVVGSGHPTECGQHQRACGWESPCQQDRPERVRTRATIDQEDPWKRNSSARCSADVAQADRSGDGSATDPASVLQPPGDPSARTLGDLVRTGHRAPRNRGPRLGPRPRDLRVTW